MPLCAPDCECKWCMVCKMMKHPMFQEALDEMIDEFRALEAKTPSYSDSPDALNTTTEIETEEC